MSAALEGGPECGGCGKVEGEGKEAAKRMKRQCRVCGHLVLAVVLTVCSPLIAVGVCMAAIVKGECCKVDPDNISSIDDLM